MLFLLAISVLLLKSALDLGGDGGVSSTLKCSLKASSVARFETKFRIWQIAYSLSP